ncbi:MAG: right-handed parallel beta-helix repeat-containing protein [Candidatus Bathyarchaeota archaeon]|nr:right-handed parallel beta-helix repeat-containing protein [Candidatus Bathyarchaeota archaeon]
MKRKAVAVAFVQVLLVLAVVGALLVDSACANFMPLNIPPHSIEIMANGEVAGTDNIKRFGAVYEFTADIAGNIVVFCDNLTINGNGYSLIGKGESSGIFLEGRQNVTVKNLTVSNFERGVVYSYYRSVYDASADYSSDSDCRNNALIANNITNNRWGVYCYHVQNITFYGNTIANNSEIGISTFNSGEIHIVGNTFAENNVAVRFTNCQNSNVYGNNFIRNANQTSVDPESKSGLVFGWSTINWNKGQLGNFWSDYEGRDGNIDGVGDAPYVIDENNQDNYPLMLPHEASLSELAQESSPASLSADAMTLLLIIGSTALGACACTSLWGYFKKHKRGVKS